MPPSTNHPSAGDLGHGVAVEQCSGQEIVLRSNILELALKPREGRFPGSAVRWQDEIWEVVRAEEVGQESRQYRLRPWQEGETLRTVLSLDRQSIDGLAIAAAEHARDVLRRQWLVALMPITGNLPRTIQLDLERRLNFPAERATLVSALAELAIGGLGLFQAVLLFAASEWILPPQLRWLAGAGPPLFVEALIRMWFCTSQDEPIGSILLLPLRLFEARAQPRIVDHPSPLDWNPDSGILRLSTAEGRPDWEPGGVLQYRGRLFRLATSEGRSRDIVYHFEEVPAGAEVTLQLMPPKRQAAERAEEPTPGPLTMWWRTLLMSLAPGRYQKVFFPKYGTPAVLPTIATACVELIGAGANMLSAPASGFSGLVDLVFVAEGLVRLGFVAIRREPMGSILGLPLRSAFQRWTLTSNNSKFKS